jgi:ABC-type multidrug transport system ATPase subunit
MSFVQQLVCVCMHTQQIMEVLHALCQEEGHTVLVTIHQPRSSIYQLFDDVYLISQVCLTV